MLSHRVATAVLGLAFLGFAGCSGGTKGGKEPVASLTSVQYAEEFKRNKEEARKKYLDSIVELTGVVKQINIAPPRDVILILEGEVGDSMPGVECVPRETDAWKRVLPGQTVKLRGRAHQFSIYGQLMDCEIVDVKGKLPPTFSPDGLVAEYEKDGDERHERTDMEYIILEAEITKVAPVEKSRRVKKDLVEVTLKTTTAKQKVSMVLANFEAERGKDLKVGQKIKALGRYSGNTVSHIDIILSRFLVLDSTP